jgi:threonyl-tRNA synthetase
MTEYKKYMEEAAKRDHRRIGREQELFVFHDLSPGSAFFLPLGMRIYNTLLEFMKVSIVDHPHRAIADNAERVP